MQAIERNTKEHGIRFFGLGTEEQGIVHIIGPELGLTQPGMTIACGDSHTSTHGALGSLAFGDGHLADPRHPRHADPFADPAQGAQDRGGGHAGRRRVRQGPHHPHHRATSASTAASASPTSTPGPPSQCAPHGGAADAVQHEHRGRRPRRLREPGRDHLRVHPGKHVRARREGLRHGAHLLEEHRFRPGRRLRRRVHAGRLGGRADGRLGHQPRAGRGRLAQSSPGWPTRRPANRRY